MNIYIYIYENMQMRMCIYLYLYTFTHTYMYAFTTPSDSYITTLPTLYTHYCAVLSRFADRILCAAKIIGKFVRFNFFFFGDSPEEGRGFDFP